MDFGGDDRGVAVQIGAVLLLGFLVVSLSMYQATVVPRENERVEFRHNQHAVSDMQEVRNGILRTASTGESVPVSVELGMRYPARLMFVNPSPPSGTLSTSSLGAVSIRNVAVDDATTAADDYRDIRDFWDGAPRGYPTKALTYRPSYNRYPNAPATVYENGVLYNRFDRGNGTANVAVTGQTLVSGTRLSLVTLTGNLSRGGSETLSVDPRAVSRSTRTVSVTGNASGPVSVVVPTRLSESDWERLLRESGQLTGDGGHVVDVVGHADAGTVEILLEPNVTYQLGMSRVRVGTGSDDAEAAYLTGVERLDGSLRTGESDAFVVEARDAYNNPVSAALDESPGDGTLVGPVAEERGRYRYVYTAPETPGSTVIDVSLVDQTNPGFDPRHADDVRYVVNVTASSDDGDGPGANPDGERDAVVDNYDDQNTDRPFPPANPVGVVSAFDQAQTDNNQYAQLSSSSKTLRVGTRTANVKTDVSGYELTVTYAYSSNGDQPVDVNIVDENGETLQRETLSVTKSETTRTIVLNEDAENAVKSTGELYVVYDNGGEKKSRLLLYYQVTRTQ